MFIDTIILQYFESFFNRKVSSDKIKVTFHFHANIRMSCSKFYEAKLGTIQY